MQATGTPLARALDLLGDQWSLLILQSVFLRVRRYTDLRARLGVADAVLAARLRGLLEAGVLEQAPYADERRTRHEYRLTASGLDLWRFLVGVWAWESRWIPGRAADLPQLHHLTCGDATNPELSCGTCADAVTARDTAVEREPGLPVAVAVTARRFRRQGWELVAGDPLLFYPQTMDILGDRWATGILVAAFLGTRRFADFQRELGISPSVLSERLRRLVELRVLATAPSGRSGASEYRLTPKGHGFFPVFALLVGWASEHLGGDPGIVITHRDHSLVPALRCDRCGEILERRQVRFTVAGSGPG